ncbi:MAG: glycosyltransferase [Sedimenticola sp.]
MPDYTIIALGSNSWHGPWMNRQHIMSRFGKSFDIIYSTPLWTNWSLSSEEWKNSSWSGSFKRVDNVWVDETPKWLIRIPRLPLLSRFIEYLGAKRLRRFIDQNRGKKLIVYLFRPEFFNYIKPLAADLIIYHIYDVYDKEASWSIEKDKWQKLILNQADLVIASSQEMANHLIKKTNYTGSIKILKNGADYQAFRNGIDEKVPSDLATIPHPRISYVGRLNIKVDLSLIIELATRRPEWHFILVGPEVFFDSKTKELLEICKKIHNIHFLGEKSHKELPSYTAQMDVNTMIYVLNKDNWSYYGYPLKLHEYLATGKPVISSNLSSVREYDQVVAIAHNPDEWEQLIEDAINGNGRGCPKLRQEVAYQNSWDVRVKQLNDWINHLN